MGNNKKILVRKVDQTVRKGRNKVRPLDPQTLRLCVENVASWSISRGPYTLDLGSYSRVHHLKPAALRARGAPPPSRMKINVNVKAMAPLSRPILQPIQAAAEHVSSPRTRFQLQTLGTLHIVNQIYYI